MTSAPSTPPPRRGSDKRGPARARHPIEDEMPRLQAYMDHQDLYFLDARRFSVIPAGEAEDLVCLDSDAPCRYGAWVARWKHWSLRVLG